MSRKKSKNRKRNDKLYLRSMTFIIGGFVVASFGFFYELSQSSGNLYFVYLFFMALLFVGGLSTTFTYLQKRDSEDRNDFSNRK